MIKNEKGLTLIEMLGAIVLISVIATLTMTLLSSSHLFWGNSVEKYSKDANAELAMAAISKYVTDSVDVIVKSGSTTTEVRIKTGEGSEDYNYKSFRFQNRTLSLYDLVIDDDGEFNSNDLSESKYTSEFVLAENLDDFQVDRSGNRVEFSLTFDHVEKNTVIKIFDLE